MLWSGARRRTMLILLSGLGLIALLVLFILYRSNISPSPQSIEDGFSPANQIDSNATVPFTNAAYHYKIIFPSTYRIADRNPASLHVLRSDGAQVTVDALTRVEYEAQFGIASHAEPNMTVRDVHGLYAKEFRDSRSQVLTVFIYPNAVSTELVIRLRFPDDVSVTEVDKILQEFQVLP